MHLKELNIVAVPQRIASDKEIDFQDLSKDDDEDGTTSKPGETKTEKEENAAGVDAFDFATPLLNYHVLLNVQLNLVHEPQIQVH